MFNKYMQLPPLARRAILALLLFAICFICAGLPKSKVTDALFVVSLCGWYWAVGLVRPTFLFIYYLLRAVLRYQFYK